MNSPEGAVAEVEGSEPGIAAFLVALHAELPPLAQIVGVEQSTIPAEGNSDFRILASDSSEAAFTLVPPDICVCEQCLAEIRDPENRRFNYPFTNCTNCGPRYSIILDIPYDRSMTTMAEFAMCEDCRREYEGPSNRRFHAQPNACAKCGPSLQLAAGGDGNTPAGDARNILRRVAEVLKSGGIVAWKGLGGYQLACDARQAAAVKELRRRKHRNEKPFAVMVGDVLAAERLCFIDDAERSALTSPERPIVLLTRRDAAGLAEAVSPNNPNVGVMLPCTPMHDLLFRVLRDEWEIEPVLIMTSGNLSEEPIVIDNVAAETELSSVADAFVHHNRRIHTRVDDSIVRIVESKPMVLRRARGYAPRPVWLGRGTAEVLGCGAQQKSTFCLTRAGFALPSQHLGDLDNYETLRFFEETLERMQRLFHAHPKVIAHDMHPGYMSTQLAMRLPAERRIAVQHHHAHIASCMAEHQLDGRVIGVAWDGTGFGTDGTIWGGEFLAADLVGFDRYAHLRPVPLPGGDSAVREPWRIARSYLRDAFEGAIPHTAHCRDAISAERIRVVDAMLEKRINTAMTSSAGRLFDAVASLIGLHHTASFEGQAAMALEAAADSAGVGQGEVPYGFMLSGSGPLPLDFRPMVLEIVRDLERGTHVSIIASRFHCTLVTAITAVCHRMRDDLGLTRVCLSGGCFQNIRLLRGCVEQLRAKGFAVFYQRQIPANDGGISLGQAAIACEWIERGL